MTPAQALELATDAHAGQLDKSGAPYIGHIHRVIGHLPADASDSARIVAALHDVVEDTDTTLEDLRDAGLTAAEAAAVDAMTHRPGERHEDYHARVAADSIALIVKRADIADNTDPARLAQLPGETRERLTAKYAAARAALGL